MLTPQSTDAFDEWYRAAYQTVFRSTLVVCCGDEFRANDVTNEAFARAFQRWATLQSSETRTQWTAQVAINLERRRRWRNRKERALALGLQNQQMHSDFSTTVEIDEREELWAAVSALPRRQREVIALRYVEDRTQREIAERLGIAPGTAGALLSQARMNLRKMRTSDRRNE